MAAFVSLVLTTAALLFILRPLMMKRSESATSTNAQPQSTAQGLIDRRDTLYRSMRDLEYDRKLGNVVDEDYTAMLSDYQSQAIVILKEIDGRLQGIDAQVEEEITARRQPSNPSPQGTSAGRAEEELEKQSASPREVRGR